MLTTIIDPMEGYTKPLELEIRWYAKNNKQGKNMMSTGGNRIRFDMILS